MAAPVFVFSPFVPDGMGKIQRQEVVWLRNLPFSQDCLLGYLLREIMLPPRSRAVATTSHASINFRRLSNKSDRA